MKKLLVIIILLGLVVPSVKATGQSGDIIRLEGKEWVLTLVYEGKDLQSLFPSYYKDGEIQARWFSGELRAGKGNLVRYVHDGFDRNMETEQILTVQNGKVLKTETYHNYRRPGLNLKKAQKEIACRFPWKRFPEYRGERIIRWLSLLKKR